MKIETEINIEAPPEVVWKYLVDWEGLERWMLEGKGFRVTSAEREGVGVTAEATIRIAGVSTHDAVRVSRWEPPHLLEIEHYGWVSGSGMMRCRSMKSGTHLFWRETLLPPWGPVGAVGLAFFKPILRRIFGRDLKMLKSLVEQRSVK